MSQNICYPAGGFIALLSPAKTMKPYSSSAIAVTNPVFAQETERLVKYLQSYTPEQIAKLFSVNEILAKQTYERYSDFFEARQSPAIYSYSGLQYKSLDIAHLDVDTSYLDDHFRILDALYGVLKPHDGIKPYRLDFHVPMALPSDKDLYSFWNDKCYEEIKKTEKTIILLCSQEYAQLITPFVQDHSRCIEIRFLTEKKGIRKIESTSAKMARGAMARWIIRHKITTVSKLIHFQEDGYVFDSDASNTDMMVFVRQK